MQGGNIVPRNTLPLWGRVVKILILFLGWQSNNSEWKSD